MAIGLEFPQRQATQPKTQRSRHVFGRTAPRKLRACLSRTVSGLSSQLLHFSHKLAKTIQKK